MSGRLVIDQAPARYARTVRLTSSPLCQLASVRTNQGCRLIDNPTAIARVLISYRWAS